MTREHKLALIIGFSLMLLVGVLISDHLSRAQRAEVAGVTPADSSQVDAMAVGHLPRPIDRVLAGPETATALVSPPDAPMEAAPSGDRPLVGGMPPAGDGQGRDPGVGTPTDQADASRPEVTLAQGPRTNPDLGGGSSAGGPPRPGGVQSELIERAVHQGWGVQRGADGAITLVPPSRPQPGTGPGTPVGAPPGQSPAKPPVDTAKKNQRPAAPERFYLVNDRDSLFSIAQRQYGDGQLWRKLAEYNRDRVGRDGVVRVGVRLALPGKDVLTGNPADAAVPPPRTSPDLGVAGPRTVRVADGGRGKPDAAAPDAKKTALYTVQPGDTAGKIAQKFFGSAKRVPDLIALNSDTIEDEDSLRAGVILRVSSSN